MAKASKTRQRGRGLMKISEAAQAAGVNNRTIEYYILLQLVRPIRTTTGGRRFDARLIRRIRLIRQLNQSGYTLQAVRQVYLSKR